MNPNAHVCCTSPPRSVPSPGTMLSSMAYNPGYLKDAACAVRGQHPQWTPPPPLKEETPPRPQSMQSLTPSKEKSWHDPPPKIFSPNYTRGAFFFWRGFLVLQWHGMGPHIFVFIQRYELMCRGVSKYFMSTCSCQGMCGSLGITVTCTYIQAHVQATVGVGTVLIWYRILIRDQT